MYTNKHTHTHTYIYIVRADVKRYLIFYQTVLQPERAYKKAFSIRVCNSNNNSNQLNYEQYFLYLYKKLLLRE